MRYWWVNQGLSYPTASVRGIITAPKLSDDGRRLPHWDSLLLVTSGDVILHAAGQRVRAVGPALSLAGDDQVLHHGELVSGRSVRCAYQYASAPIRLDEIPRDWRASEPHTGPFNVRGGLKQGYLYPITEAFVSRFFDEFAPRFPTFELGAAKVPAKGAAIPPTSAAEPQWLPSADRADFALPRGLGRVSSREAIRPMKYADSASHRKGRELVESLGLKGEILAALDAPTIRVVPGGSAAIKAHIADSLSLKGWASPVAVEASVDLEINAFKARCLLHVQTGNIARAFYDLMKMQSIFDQHRADVGVLIVPTKAAARVIGGNLAQFERVQQELELAFFNQIAMPIWLVAFE